MEIREIKIADLEPLIKLATDDGHGVVRPTHVAVQDGEFIGYASIGAVPMVLFYMHTKNARPIQTFKMERFCEDELRRNGVPVGCAPCSPSSPIHPYMTKLGFTSFGNMDLFLKKL